MQRSLTPLHRGGSGEPMVCLHGFMDSWRTWELVLPTLQRRHDVLALTLAGHAGAEPMVSGPTGHEQLIGAIERQMDAQGVDDAHIVGNSLGGYLALALASRGRARSVVALAPAGGWRPGDNSFRDLLAFQRALHRETQLAARHADTLVATEAGRRRVTRLLTVNHEHIPPDLLACMIRAVAGCDGAEDLIDAGLADEWTLDAERITCPVRIIWGAEDLLLPWPGAACRYREQLLPLADWVLLDGAGHYPQLDLPLETAQLIVGFTAS